MLRDQVGVRSNAGARCFAVFAVGLLFYAFATTTWAQPQPASANPAEHSADQPAQQTEPTPQITPATPSPKPPATTPPKVPTTYGLWVLAPAVIAIILAILFRQAVPALFIGLVVGGYMMVPCRSPADSIGSIPLLEGLRLAVDGYLIRSIAGTEHIQIMLFTLLIGGAVGVMSASGGTRGMVDAVSRFASTSRRGQLTGWFAGMVVFFDDYANSMIVGPSMRPVFDRLKISRAKLAYIVDSTAAPVASIALIGTWLGAELSYIQDGLDKLAAHGTPEFLSGATDTQVFISTIPYRFYPIFALWFVLVIALTGRDFGPMLKAESRRLGQSDDHRSAQTADAPTEKNASAWLAALPIIVLVGVTMAILYRTGTEALPKDRVWEWKDVLRDADAYISILYGGLASLVVASVLAFLARACSMRDAFDGALDGMARMFPAIVILVLAWAISQVSQDLSLGEVLKSRLVGTTLNADWLPVWAQLPMPVWLPLSVFICAAGVSFATGSSWTTMGILTPAVVEIAGEMAAGLPGDQAPAFFYAAVGSVLAGSIFGDHCSPISDTTVLSAIASRCHVEEHVWTQLPYAVVTAIVAMGAGNIYCMQQNKPAWQGLLIGGGVLWFLLVLIGRRPKPPVVVREIPPELIERRISGEENP